MNADGILAEIESVRRAGTWLIRALVAVAIGALIFTLVNVTLFAVDNGVPWFIAWLLDPLASVSFAAVLLAQAVLSRHGRKADGWSIALMWVAGLATWAMNIWRSAVAGDPAGLLLHSVAPALVILLAEAAPRLRRQFVEVVAELQQRLADIETRQAADAKATREAVEAQERQRRQQERELTATVANLLSIGSRINTGVSRPASSVRQRPSAARSTAKRQPTKRGKRQQVTDLPTLVERARPLLADSPDMGRPTLAAELGCTPYKAQQVLDEIRKNQPPLHAVERSA